MAAAGRDISTLHIVGFAPNALDRELENFCRFLPGFVWAKASVASLPLKLWVRFDSQESALAAVPVIDGQPFDMLDPSTMLKASLARTDLNADAWDCRQPRKGGGMCLAGTLDDLLAAASSAPRGVVAAPSTGKQEGGRRAIAASAHAHHAPSAAGNPNDTLVVMGVAEKNLTEEGMKEYFGTMDGFIALTVAPGKGGGHCFVKFANAAAAHAALEAGTVSGLDPQMAKNSLNLNKLQGGVVDKSAAYANKAWASDKGWADTDHSAKRFRGDPESTGDTLILMGVGNKGLNNETCEEFFAQMDGFMVSNFDSSGKGGGNYFVKFNQASQATAAISISQEYGLDPQLSKRSLDMAKLMANKAKDSAHTSWS